MLSPWQKKVSKHMNLGKQMCKRYKHSLVGNESWILVEAAWTELQFVNVISVSRWAGNLSLTSWETSNSNQVMCADYHKNKNICFQHFSAGFGHGLKLCPLISVELMPECEERPMASGSGTGQPSREARPGCCWTPRGRVTKCTGLSHQLFQF